MKLDRENISCPKINFTANALLHLSLIAKHEVKDSKNTVRVSIDGKKCEGFTYALGFDEHKDQDFIIDFKEIGYDGQIFQFQVVLDPFAAYYLQNAKIDYVQNFDREEEGFIITNCDQNKFQGKFWRKSPDLTPPENEKS